MVKNLYDFGGRCLKIRNICMDFEPYFKVHNLVSVQPKSIIFGQMTNLNMIFHVAASVYRLVKTWSSPQFQAEFRNDVCLLIVRAHGGWGESVILVRHNLSITPPGYPGFTGDAWKHNTLFLAHNLTDPSPRFFAGLKKHVWWRF